MGVAWFCQDSEHEAKLVPWPAANIGVFILDVSVLNDVSTAINRVNR